MSAQTLTPQAERVASVEHLTAAGFVLVPVPAGTKGPQGREAKGWNTDPARWLDSPSAAHAYLTRHPGAGVGVLHSQSGTAALDVDHEQWAALALAEVGLSLDELMNGNPYRVRGRRGEKPLWRVPDGLSLKVHKLAWPDPEGKKGPGGRRDGTGTAGGGGSGRDAPQHSSGHWAALHLGGAGAGFGSGLAGTTPRAAEPLGTLGGAGRGHGGGLPLG